MPHADGLRPWRRPRPPPAAPLQASPRVASLRPAPGAPGTRRAPWGSEPQRRRGIHRPVAPWCGGRRGSPLRPARQTRACPPLCALAPANRPPGVPKIRLAACTRPRPPARAEPLGGHPERSATAPGATRPVPTLSPAGLGPPAQAGHSSGALAAIHVSSAWTPSSRCCCPFAFVRPPGSHRAPPAAARCRSGPRAPRSPAPRGPALPPAPRATPCPAPAPGVSGSRVAIVAALHPSRLLLSSLLWKHNKKVAIKPRLPALTVLHLDLCSPTPHWPSSLGFVTNGVSLLHTK